MKVPIAWLGTIKHAYTQIFFLLQRIFLKHKWVTIGAGVILMVAASVIWFVFPSKPPKFVQATAISPATVEKINLPNPQEVIAVLSRMADERDLRHLEFTITNSLGGAEIIVSGVLDVNAQSVLKRMLTQFYKQYQTAIPITTDVIGATEQLPFTISEVITGQMASIVTSEGERVFVGDRIQGYQLVRIEPGKLIFVGDRRIEIAW